MNQDAQIVATLQFAFVLVCLWFLVFQCWRSYRVDALRQRLFALRDELFDYATSGAISYDDPAYWRLRLVTNGMIRFAHRLTFPRFLLTVVVNSLWPNPYPINQFQEWAKAVEDIRDSETRKKLHEFNVRMSDMVVRHLIGGSPTFLVLLVFFLIGALVSNAVWSFIRTTVVSSLQILEAEAAQAQVSRGGKKVYA